MRYWSFDVINLIRDFEVNKNALASIRSQIRFAKNEIKNPFLETDLAQCEARLKQLETKEIEYQMYVDMVVLGFDVIDERERTALEDLYIKGMDVTEAAKHLYLSNRGFEKLHKTALINFSKVVSPL